MKRYFAILVVLAILFSGCAMWQHPCTQAGQAELTRAQIVVSGIQEYYDPLRALVPLIPTAGPILAVAIPMALSTADQALKNLGTLIASGCTNNEDITLAQIALDDIKKLFATQGVQTAMASVQYKANLKMLNMNVGK